MIYGKKALTIEEQADQLLSRGLVAQRDDIIAILKQVSYYRLSGYWFPFRNYPQEEFKQNTSLTEIWNRYCFDRKLRLLVLDGIEKIEIALRTDITYKLSHQTGAFGYTEKSAFPMLSEFDFEKLQEEIKKEYSRSKEKFVSHFQHKYGDIHDSLPLWMATELISFGALFTMFRGISTSHSKSIAKKYNLPEPVLLSWIGSLNSVRNICAHHSRLWNREFGYKPMLPRNNLVWKQPVEIQPNKIFVILSMIQYMLGFISPTSQWKYRFLDLLTAYPNIPIREMGFPLRWKEIPFWNLTQPT
ncbi:Abi family protein [Leptospira sp. 201903074]|uniref:Abi family protein n=1 Tax=Leptospira abararensis TaxID=2810036 RepID=UPI0019648CFA|nr:Abi family protein [Leptospira abararensis]MBM9548728.1 Abi family protein [Leptospira abararensis]